MTSLLQSAFSANGVNSLYLAQLAFMIWMLVDASRRRVDSYWYWIILWVPGLGAWAYFFAFKLEDVRYGLRKRARTRKQSIEELKYQVEESPTFVNQLAIGRRYVELGQLAEAIPHLDAARAQEPDHNEVLYLLAQCHAAADRRADSVVLLEDIVRRAPKWGDLQAWYLLIDLKSRAGDARGALDDARRLVTLSQTLRNEVVLADRLVAAGLRDEAKSLLNGALKTHRFDPGHVRRRDKPWAKQARAILEAA